jgi:hypothetical protein
MNEELQQAIVKVIESMTGVAQSAYSFGAEQMPEVIEQLIVLNMVKSGSLFALSAFVLWMLIYTTYRQIKNRPQPGEYARNGLWWDVREITVLPEVAWVLWALFGGVPGIIAFSTAVHEGFDLVKLIIAPKVWLIEYAAGLVK